MRKQSRRDFMILLIVSLVLGFLYLIMTMCPFCGFETNMHVEISDDENGVCYDPEGYVRILVKNIEPHDIMHMKIMFFDVDGEIVTADFNSSLSFGESKIYKVYYDKKSLGEFGRKSDGTINNMIVPIFNISGKAREERVDYVIEDIPDCIIE